MWNIFKKYISNIKKYRSKIQNGEFKELFESILTVCKIFLFNFGPEAYFKRKAFFAFLQVKALVAILLCTNFYDSPHVMRSELCVAKWSAVYLFKRTSSPQSRLLASPTSKWFCKFKPQRSQLLFFMPLIIHRISYRAQSHGFHT